MSCNPPLAANAHVVKDVEPYMLVGGNPAQSIKPRFDLEVTDLLLKLAWWHLPVQDIQRLAPHLSQVPTAASVREMLAMVGRAV